MRARSGTVGVKDAWLVRLGERDVGSRAESDGGDYLPQVAREALVRAYIRTQATLGDETMADATSTRAIMTLQNVLSGTHTECSVGELVRVVVDTERVIEAYNAWQAGKLPITKYHDVVMSALAKLRVEQGL